MKIQIKNSLFISMLSVLFIPVIHAGTPVWTYSAPSPASVSVSTNSTATVEYTVTNQSNKSKNLILQAAPGLSASSCYLAGAGSTCVITITINGSEISSTGVFTGPVFCEQGNANQCYQPEQANQLNITLTSSSRLSTTSIYAQKGCGVVYSFDSGYSWNPMINQQSSYCWNTFWGQSLDTVSTGSVAVDAQGGMYQAVQAAPANLTVYGQVLYSQDGLTWSTIDVTFPSSDPIDQANVAALYNTTLYVGTVLGYIVSTTDQGATWNTTLNQGNQLDSSSISAITTDDSGNVYVGAGTGAIYYSTDDGSTWTQATTSPSSGNTITSLAVTNVNGQITWYATASDHSQYYSYYSTDQGLTWTEMIINWPSSDSSDTIRVFAASDNSVYAGTRNGYVYTLASSGTNTWDANQQSAALESPVTALTVTQSSTFSLSPLFVEGTLGTSTTPAALPVNGTATLTVTNYSLNTATNVSIQSLPTGVTQTLGADCASVAPLGTCSIALSTTEPFAPCAVTVVGTGSSTPIEYIALVSSMSDYLVYNVDTGANIAYVVDNTNASDSTVVWSPTTDILNIAQSNTSPCSGATDGYCNTGVILSQGYSGDYAAGLCAAQNSSSSFPGGSFTPNWWYLPSVCEFGSGLFPNNNTHTIDQCDGVATGVFSLYGLGYLTDLRGDTRFYWASTEYAHYNGDDGFSAWNHSFIVNGGGLQSGSSKTDPLLSVRCVQGLSY